MGLFKSREEKRIEREMAARKAVANFRKQVKLQKKHEEDYVKKAIRAKQIGDPKMLEMLRAQIKRTHAMRFRFERSMLLLETAMQAKDQIESFESFGKGMSAIAKSIEKAYGVTNLVKTQREYEMAMGKAASMEERIDVFLESSFDQAEDLGEEDADIALSDADLDRLLEGGAAEAEGARVDDEIQKGLADIQKELGR